MTGPGPAKSTAAAVLAPVLLVFLWSTGFVGAKWGLPYAEPFTLSALRFAIAGAVFLGLALVAGAPWPRGWRQIRDVSLVGILLHGIYLSGVFWAIANGTPAWMAALYQGALIMTHRDRPRDRGGGFPRLSGGVAHGSRCPAPPRHALLAESLGKPSLWVIISAPWY